MRRVVVYLGALIVVALATGLYYYFKKPADVRQMKADIELSADELVARYSNEDEGNLAFVGKIISVTGRVTSIEKQGESWTIYLESSDPLVGVTCNFYAEESSSVQSVRPGDEVTIKGSCTGKIMDVVLNHCSIIKQL